MWLGSENLLNTAWNVYMQWQNEVMRNYLKYHHYWLLVSLLVTGWNVHDQHLNVFLRNKAPYSRNLNLLHSTVLFKCKAELMKLGSGHPPWAHKQLKTLGSCLRTGHCQEWWGIHLCQVDQLNFAQLHIQGPLLSHIAYLVSKCFKSTSIG